MFSSIYHYLVELPLFYVGPVGTVVLGCGIAFTLLSLIFGPRKVLKPMFGEFDSQELNKFILLGIIFGLIIGIYWTLRPLKDALFQDIVGGEWQPRAKWLSLVVIFPLVIIYSKLVEKLSRQTLFYVMAAIYGTATLVMAYFFFDPQMGLENLVADKGRLLGWIWYVFVESFGSLIIALFWAFATDITSAESAKKGFFFVIMFGQLGGIFVPLVTKIPKIYGISNAYTVVICGILIFLIIPLVWFFMRSIPADQLKGFGEKEDIQETKEKEKKKGEGGFLEGLKLMLSQPYLLGIFGIITFYEIIVTVFDYYFKLMAQAQILDKAEKLAFLGEYALYTNLATFLCLVLGISNIQRKMSLTASLTLMPILVSFAIVVFRFYPALQPLFWLMVASKAVNYALNSPSMKQLYIPTTKDVRFKSQAWIESFGSRGSKAAGSAINDQHKSVLVTNGPEWADPAYAKANMFGPGDTGSFWYMALSCYFFIGIIALWIVVALYLGRTYQRAVDNNKVVC